MPVVGLFPVQKVSEVRGVRNDQVQTPSATKNWFPKYVCRFPCYYVDANGDREKGLCVGLLGLL